MQVNCAHCQQPLIVDATNAGRTVKCPKCGNPLQFPEIPQATEPQSSLDFSAINSSVSSASSFLSRKRFRSNKYPALITISWVFRILGVFAIVLAVLSEAFLILTFFGGLAGHARSEAAEHIQALAGVGSIVGLLIGTIWNIMFFGTLALGYFAISESIRVIIDIESNTAATADK